MSSDRRYVAVDGPPGSGATALARALATHTGARLVADPAPTNPFRDDFAKDPVRYAFQTQTFCLLARYRQQVELSQPELFGPAGAVADYCFARDRLFAALTLEEEELHLYDRIHRLLDARLARPDLVVYLTADREILRSRIRRLVPSSDRVIKLKVLDRLAESMNNHFFSYGGPLLVINTSDFDAVEEPKSLEELTEVVRKTRAGVHHFRPSV